MKTRKGTISEHIALAWAMKNGYEVYRNVCGSGPADLIFCIDGEYVPVDVKSVAFANTSPIYNKLNDRQKKLGVQLLYVQDENDVFWDFEIEARRACRQ